MVRGGVGGVVGIATGVRVGMGTARGVRLVLGGGAIELGLGVGGSGTATGCSAGFQASVE